MGPIQTPDNPPNPKRAEKLANFMCPSETSRNDNKFMPNEVMGVGFGGIVSFDNASLNENLEQGQNQRTLQQPIFQTLEQLTESHEDAHQLT